MTADVFNNTLLLLTTLVSDHNRWLKTKSELNQWWKSGCCPTRTQQLNLYISCSNKLINTCLSQSDASSQPQIYQRNMLKLRPDSVIVCCLWRPLWLKDNDGATRLDSTFAPPIVLRTEHKEKFNFMILSNQIKWRTSRGTVITAEASVWNCHKTLKESCCWFNVLETGLEAFRRRDGSF